ncbi:MAG: HupE/UreJ family protein [Trueperaceae bacterium]
MNRYPHFSRPLLVLLIAGLALWPTVSAHLMVAQKGTLNLSGNGAYLVVSVPTSALTDVDDDGDGLLSEAELSLHVSSITQQLQTGLQLSDADGPRALEGIRLTLSPKDSEEGQPADQLIVLGRYALADANKPLTFRTDLWGTSASEQSLSLTITKDLEDEQLLMLTPQHPQARLYESVFMVFVSFLKHGMEHVLSGLDHLLFLLVVVSAGWGWKKILTALSIFTVGHALSLMAVVYGGLTAPSRIVEPAIAATIVGLALYDLWVTRRTGTPPRGRLALVFGCSLIHGLGLGSALAELGISPAHQGVTLLGFNLGIELGQLSVAALALLVFSLLGFIFGKRSVQMASSAMTFVAVMAGGVWFVERVVF